MSNQRVHQKRKKLKRSNLMTRCSVLQTFRIASEPAGSSKFTDDTKSQKNWREFSYRQRQIQGQQISDFENIC